MSGVVDWIGTGMPMPSTASGSAPSSSSSATICGRRFITA
jgi:hypothetical protein